MREREREQGREELLNWLVHVCTTHIYTLYTTCICNVHAVSVYSIYVKCPVYVYTDVYTSLYACNAFCNVILVVCIYAGSGSVLHQAQRVEVG